MHSDLLRAVIPKPLVWIADWHIQPPNILDIWGRSASAYVLYCETISNEHAEVAKLGSWQGYRRWFVIENVKLKHLCMPCAVYSTNYHLPPPLALSPNSALAMWLQYSRHINLGIYLLSFTKLSFPFAESPPFHTLLTWPCWNSALYLSCPQGVPRMIWLIRSTFRVVLEMVFHHRTSIWCRSALLWVSE